MPSSVDACGRMRSLLTDLLKAYICTDHELFIANFYVHGFNKHSLLFHTLIFEHLKRNKDNKFLWLLICWDPSMRTSYAILGPSHRNICIYDIFLEIVRFIVVVYLFIRPLFSHYYKLQKNTEKIFKWFCNNNLISDVAKTLLIVSAKRILEIHVSSCPAKNEDIVRPTSVST